MSHKSCTSPDCLKTDDRSHFLLSCLCLNVCHDGGIICLCVFPFISVTHSNDTLVSTCLPSTHWTCSDWRQWGHITPPCCLFPIRGRGSHYSAITTDTDFTGCGKIKQNICYRKWHFTEIILLDLLMSSDLCLIQLAKRSQGISGGGFVTHLTDKSFLFDFVWFLPTAI